MTDENPVWTNWKEAEYLLDQIKQEIKSSMHGMDSPIVNLNIIKMLMFYKHGPDAMKEEPEESFELLIGNGKTDE